jgi:surfactin synthase thioesterase subunit
MIRYWRSVRLILKRSAMLRDNSLMSIKMSIVRSPYSIFCSYNSERE